MSLKLYYDMADYSGDVDEQRHTGDIEFVHSFVLRDGHEVAWGLNYSVHNHGTILLGGILNPNKDL